MPIFIEWNGSEVSGGGWGEKSDEFNVVIRLYSSDITDR